jgi:hypothetical protein
VINFSSLLAFVDLKVVFSLLSYRSCIMIYTTPLSLGTELEAFMNRGQGPKKFVGRDHAG